MGLKLYTFELTAQQGFIYCHLLKSQQLYISVVLGDVCNCSYLNC